MILIKMIIDCKKIAEKIIEGLKNQPTPKKFLAAVLVGNPSTSSGQASKSFILQKEKAAKVLGVDFRLYEFSESIKNDELRSEVLKIAQHKTCGSVIVQLPLPEHINKHSILNVIPREKDVDVLGERALGAFYTGRNSVLPPAVGVVEEILTVMRNTPIHANIANEGGDEEKIVEKELSYKLTGIFFEVQNELGRFARERQYADALEKKLKEKDIKYRKEFAISVVGRKSNFADFVIEDRVLVELKRKPINTGDDYRQVKRYLESANLKLGLLVNFSLEYLKPKRILNPRFENSNSDPHLLNSHMFVDSHYGSMKVAVVGLGFLVGKPISIWLQGRAKEIILFDEGSDFLLLREADLVITGVGSAGIIKPDILKEEAVVIDFGYSQEATSEVEHVTSKSSGDLDSSRLTTNYKLQTISYTPTPGGTGPILVAKLLENFYVLSATESHRD